MKFYIYEVETKKVVEIFDGDTNEDCEARLSCYDTDTHGGTYSPAFGTVDGLIEMEPYDPKGDFSMYFTPEHYSSMK